MKNIDKNTRFFIDIDLKSGKIINWDYDQRDKLVRQKMKKPFHHRIFLTKGQYTKFVKKYEKI
jgi:hypothetical protein